MKRASRQPDPAALTFAEAIFFTTLSLAVILRLLYEVVGLVDGLAWMTAGIGVLNIGRIGVTMICSLCSKRRSHSRRAARASLGFTWGIELFFSVLAVTWAIAVVNEHIAGLLRSLDS